MSGLATRWAAQQHPPKCADKAVLWALADASGGDSWEAFPSIAAISLFASLNRKQVIASLDRLERLRLIADTGRRVGSTRQIKVYRLRPEASPIGDPLTVPE